MMLFMPKSKKRAKERLINCIRCDRTLVFEVDKLSIELEKLINKYARIDGNVKVQIIHKEKNKRYIQAVACLKG